MKYNVALVGATGMVGRKMLQVLAERQLPIDNLYLFASARSAGNKVEFLGKEYTVIELTEENILARKIDIALFYARFRSPKPDDDVAGANAHTLAHLPINAGALPPDIPGKNPLTGRQS